MRIPGIFRVIIKWITPAFLLTIFGMFILQNAFGWNFSLADPQFDPTPYVKDLIGPNPSFVARLTMGFILAMALFSLLLVNIAGKNWNRRQAGAAARNATADTQVEI